MVDLILYMATFGADTLIGVAIWLSKDVGEK
jgi:hypothetical protein